MKTLQHKSLRYFLAPMSKEIYYYYPAHPSPQKDGQGHPMLSLMGAGNIYFLQVSSTWQATEEELQELTELLIEKELIENSQQLQPAPLKDIQARLCAYPDFQTTYSTSSTSGHYPYAAVFNLTLSEEEQQQVVPAFEGQQEKLAVQYVASIEWIYNVEARLEGLFKLSQFAVAEEDTESALRAYIEKAIEDGQLQIHIQLEKPTHQLLESIKTKLLDAAVEQGLRWLNDPNSGDPHMEISLEKGIPHPIDISATADIGAWVRESSSNHLKIMNQ
ncbi:hypothetical protein [Nonlabens xiamenensis]|uniref:hypothetical protein n=1 Tax=Nonlabens xiamenensis TaxID=2341043 RepID=UPI000F60EF0C|nr:hypothetical protein [Nonlabens xiamenensis]